MISRDIKQADSIKFVEILPDMIRGGRSSNFELLRIFSMLAIVSYHYVVHGGFGDLSACSYSLNRNFLMALTYGGKLGVNLFVLISGFFLCESHFSLNKASKFVVTTTVFSVIIYMLHCGMGWQLPFKNPICILMPLSYNTWSWWFLNTYFMLYILVDYLNLFLYSISRRMLRRLIIIMIFCWSVLPVFKCGRMPGASLGWFIMLYFIAAYIRKYLQDRFQSVWVLPLAMIMYMSCCLFGWFTECIFGIPVYLPNGDYSLPLLIVSLVIFVGVRNWRCRYIKAINLVASCMVGVYMLHDALGVKEWLWLTVFKNASYMNSPELIMHFCRTIIVVFIGGILITALYRVTIGWLVDKLVCVGLNAVFVVCKGKIPTLR